MERPPCARQIIPIARAEIDMAFGDPLTLNQVMERLQSRDFQVLDYPMQH